MDLSPSTLHGTTSRTAAGIGSSGAWPRLLALEQWIFLPNALRIFAAAINLLAPGTDCFS
jgi:hypothetical protein